MELICLFSPPEGGEAQTLWCERLCSAARGICDWGSLRDLEAPSPAPASCLLREHPAAERLQQQARSTGALHTELLGRGLQLPGAPALLALGAQHHLEGLPGLWAFLGGHRVVRAKRYSAVRRDYGGTIEKPLRRKRVGSRERVQLPAKQANFPPNRFPASHYLLVPAPPRSVSPGKVGARAERWEVCEGAGSWVP